MQSETIAYLEYYNIVVMIRALIWSNSMIVMYSHNALFINFCSPVKEGKEGLTKYKKATFSSSGSVFWVSEAEWPYYTK